MSEKRATLEELKTFANQVREAGGGNPLDALMPSTPGDPSQCLIAKNLNFNCRVDGIGERAAKELNVSIERWAMFLTDEATRDAIAEKLGLRKFYGDGNYAVLLPAPIGRVARDFDESEAILGEVEYYFFARNNGADIAKPNLSSRKRRIVKEMLPYIEESQREAMMNATYINDDGTIVL